MAYGKEFACNAGDTVLILGQEDPTPEEIATQILYSSLEIPQTEEPGGLQSRGHKRWLKLATKPPHVKNTSSCFFSHNLHLYELGQLFSSF